MSPCTGAAERLSLDVCEKPGRRGRGRWAEVHPGGAQPDRECRSLRHARSDIGFQNVCLTGGVDDQVAARQITEAKGAVGGDGGGGRPLGDLRTEAGRAEELRGAGGVPGRVVVETAVGLDLHGGERHNLPTQVEYTDGDLGPVDPSLHESLVVVAEAGHQGRRQLGGRPNPRDSERGTAGARLDAQRQAKARDQPL
jgi:hypothetical protein